MKQPPAAGGRGESGMVFGGWELSGDGCKASSTCGEQPASAAECPPCPGSPWVPALHSSSGVRTLYELLLTFSLNTSIYETAVKK